MANKVFSVPVKFKAYSEEEAGNIHSTYDYIIREIGTAGLLKLKKRYQENILVRGIVKTKIGSALPGVNEYVKSVQVPAKDQVEANLVKETLEYMTKDLGPKGIVKLEKLYSDPEIKAKIKSAIS